MKSTVITDVRVDDRRYRLPGGAGSDAVHTDPIYSYAAAKLQTDGNLTGCGLALTLGAGNELVCKAISLLSESLRGREIEELMADFGSHSRALADHPQLRWLGPHKGVIHLALASITNACFDLWAKSRDVPLWQLLLDLDSQQTVALLDLSHIEDALTSEEAVGLLEANRRDRSSRMKIIGDGFPAYDTSVGWLGYDDELIHENARRALGRGFQAVKLKVGSRNVSSDIRRGQLLRKIVGDDIAIMVDANQQWSLPQAMLRCRELAEISPYWIEEPLHPDDVVGHRTLSESIAPLRLAVGEAVPNRVVFKNYLQCGAAHFIQADATRLAGVSELITVSLLARKFDRPVAPHAGDMGQIHQHFVFYNHIALGAEPVFLEYIPHLSNRFLNPAEVRQGRYIAPSASGAGTELCPL